MDKWLHVLCGYIIALTIGIWLPWAGAAAGVVAALGKEYVMYGTNGCKEALLSGRT